MDFLHFYDNGSACLNRSQYGPKINKAMKPFRLEYDYKNDKVILKMFGVLMSDDQKTHTSFCQEAIEGNADSKRKRQ